MAEEAKSLNLSTFGKSRFIRIFFLFGAVTVWALLLGYNQVFSYFPPYDDEGYLMMTVKQFVAGNVLYDQIYTQYGPVYYFYKWIGHGLTGLPVTHNITRLTTLMMWAVTAFLCGIFTFRLTRSTLSGAAAYILTFLILFRTVYEPGHPQELCGLLLVAGLLLSTGNNTGRNLEIRIAFLGSIACLLVLTKINLGVFLIAALAISNVSSSGKSRLQRAFLIGFTLIAALLPFVLFRNYLGMGWARLSILVFAAMISCLITSLISVRESVFTARHYFISAAAFGLTGATVLLWIYSRGSSIEPFFYGTFLQHLSFGDRFIQPAPIQRYASVWGIFAFAAAVAIWILRRKWPAAAKRLISIMKLAYGVCVVLTSFINYSDFVNVFALLSFATPFLWVLLLNRGVVEKDTKGLFPRVFLVVAAILQPLQIFPIAGTQMNYGSFLMVLVGVVCIHDALKEFKRFYPNSLGKPIPQAVFVIVMGATIISYSAFRLFDAKRIYAERESLNFEGAGRIRLLKEDAALYAFLVEDLKENCDSFITMPGIYSLNFWANIDPPTTSNATAWGTLLSDGQQRAIVERLKMYPRSCAVYNPTLMENTLGGQSLESVPLADFILKNYTEKGRMRDYRILINRRR